MENSAQEKTCPRCAEQVKLAAVVCRFCGHEFVSSHTPTTLKPANPQTLSPRRGFQVVQWAVGALIFVGIVYALSSNNAPTPSQTAPEATASSTQSVRMPQEELNFISATQNARDAYRAAGNDMAKGGTRSDRRAAICQALQSSLSVNNWLGTIKSLSSNSDGKGVLLISIADQITVETWNNELSDISDQTLMDQRSEVFRSASAMKEGDQVMFSGTFIPSDVDCVRESSLTLRGSMEEPAFVFRFASVSPPAPIAPPPQAALPQALANPSAESSQPLATPDTTGPTENASPEDASHPTASIQPSYSCASVTNLAEQLICSDRDLAAMDVEIASLYRKAREVAASPATLIDEQRGWINERNQCTNTTCIRESYIQRKADIERWLPGQ